MQNYLNQLIEDMHLAATRVPQSKIPEDEFDEDYMMELEEMEHQPMSMLFGLTIEQFPSSDKLTSEQLTLMATEFEQLWEAYSFNPNFPEGLPARRRYELMREEIDHGCAYWPGWTQDFEFCTYEPDVCHFGKEFCWCKDFEYDDLLEMNATNRSDEELPF